MNIKRRNQDLTRALARRRYQRAVDRGEVKRIPRSEFDNIKERVKTAIKNGDGWLHDFYQLRDLQFGNYEALIND